MTDDPFGHRRWWSNLLRESFGLSFWLFAALALLMAGICYLVLGHEGFASAISRDRQVLSEMLPRVAAAQVVAGFVWVLLPRDRFSRLLSVHSGHRGLAIATAAGIITPGGPAAAFSFLAIIAAAGIERGILVTYITSWALLGIQRVVVWDVPFMGMEFSMLRFLVCLPLPLIAGVIARRVPYTVLAGKSTCDASSRR